MGNGQQSAKNQGDSVDLFHPIFRNAKAVKNSIGRQNLQVGIAMKSEKEYQEWERNRKRIPKISSVLMPETAKYESKGCCGSSGIAKLTFPKLTSNLSDEIMNRRRRNYQHFLESEMWKLLFAMVSAGEVFHMRKLKVGDIRPGNVFLNSMGQIKMATQYSWPGELTNYQKTLTNQQSDQRTLLAPEEVKDIQFGKMKDLNDPETVQSFSMGLTMLDTATIYDSDKLYSGDNVLFNYDRLQQQLKTLQSVQYSPKLTQIIERLCDPQPERRLKAGAVLSMLQPYENQIQNQLPFELCQSNTGDSSRGNHQMISHGDQNKIPQRGHGDDGNNNPHSQRYWPNHRSDGNSHEKHIQNPEVSANQQSNTHGINKNSKEGNGYNSHNNSKQTMNPSPSNRNSTNKSGFKYVPGVVFDSKDDSMFMSSLNQSKEVIKTSKVPNTYAISSGDKVNQYEAPVQTTIHYPPITINMPPSSNGINGNGNNNGHH